jgi:cytochrome c-type protein NapC
MFQRLKGRWLLILGLTFGGLLVAALLMTAGAAGLAWTNTEAFCTSCHEMRDNVYAEYKGTIHDQNRTGVRAICSDCHVPREPVAMIKRKAMASLELYGHFISHSIDTKEKFEAKRHELATHVWKRMKETDSVECRNCHNASKMSTELQSAKAQARHAKMATEGLTCIDCHFGIAHNEPAGPGPRDIDFGISKKPDSSNERKPL